MKWPTVQSIIDEYLAMTPGEVCARREEGRRRVLGLFAAKYGERQLDDLKPIDVARWLRSHEGEWRSNWTKKSALAMLQRCINWSVEMGLAPSNPVKSVKCDKGEPQRPMTDGELASLLAVADGRFRAVIRFLAWTGCRPGELSALRWSDVDLERGVCSLRRHKTAKKTKRPRTIYLAPEAVALLRSMQPADGGGSALIFTNRAGKPWNRCSLSLRMQRLRRKAGLPADTRLYGLRHRFAVTALKNGVGIKSVSLLMGHASVVMTEAYLHWLANEVPTLQAAAAQAVRPA